VDGGHEPEAGRPGGLKGQEPRKEHRVRYSGQSFMRRRRSSLHPGLVLIIPVLLLTGCLLTMPPRGSMRVSLSAGAGGKTVLPTVAVSSYLISLNGPATVSPVSTQQPDITIDLLAGTWDISVEGRDALGNSVASGAKTGVTVSAGQTTPVSIVLAAQTSGTGMIDVTVSWPAGETVDQPTGVTLDGAAVDAGTLTSGATWVRYVEAKAAGSYRLSFILRKGGVVEATVAEAVQVYGNLSSSAVIGLTGADFSHAPAAPSALAVSEGLGSLMLHWTDNSSVETGYRVERGTDGVSFGLVASIGSPATSYEDTSAVLWQQYYYQVEATNDFGASAASGSAGGKVEPPAAGGSGVLSFSGVTASAIQVGWQKATDNGSAQGTLSYTVVRSTSDNVRTVAEAQSNGTVVQDWTVDVAAVTASGLSAGTLYFFNTLVRDQGGNISAYTSSPRAAAMAATAPAYPLTVAAGGHGLVDQNGVPFLMTGDAAWSLIAQLSDEDADLYLQNRKQMGFSTILVNLIEHEFSANAPADIYGISPFTGSPFITPNPAYFAHVDHILQSAAQKGILVLLDPTYLGYDCGGQGWCAEVQAASLADMTAWGQFLGSRYASFDNIIWVMGGDTDPTAVKAKLQAVVSGIRQYDTRHPFTAHNNGEMMGTSPWAGEAWLTVNSLYTYDPAYLMAQTAYGITPSIPFFLIEAGYENEGAVTEQGLRAQSYWTVLSGGFGHVFGNCPIWHFGGDTSGTFCSGVDWQAQLGNQGSLNMQHFSALFHSRHWYQLLPDQAHTALTGGYGTSGGSDFAAAAYASDGSSIIAYLPTSRAVTVSGSLLAGPLMRAWWYNPQTGASTEIGAYATTGTQSFTPPASGDWVLVVDSEYFGFTAPGN
jgi:hypothetical protein